MFGYTALSQGYSERPRQLPLLTPRWIFIPLLLLATITLFFLPTTRVTSLLRFSVPPGSRTFPPSPFITVFQGDDSDWEGEVEMTGLTNNRGRKVLDPGMRMIEEFPFGQPEEANEWAEERLRVCLGGAGGLEDVLGWENELKEADTMTEDSDEEWVDDEWSEGKIELRRRKEWEDLEDRQENTAMTTDATDQELGAAEDLPLMFIPLDLISVVVDDEPEVSDFEEIQSKEADNDGNENVGVIPSVGEDWEEIMSSQKQEAVETFDGLTPEENHGDLIEANLEPFQELPNPNQPEAFDGLFRESGSLNSPSSLDGGESSVCGQNEIKIVILASFWFVEAVRGVNTGEAVWGRSIINSLYAQNYTILFSSLGWMNDDPALLLKLYHRYQPYVRVIISEPTQIAHCWSSTSAGGCLKSAENPSGIPAWMLLSFHYWDSVANPLGEGWTLSPSPTNGNRLISYSIEATCQHHPYVVASEREKQVYLFGKQTSYFSPTSEHPCPWSIPFLATLESSFHDTNGEDVSTHIVLGAQSDNRDADTLLSVHSDTLHNLGKLPKDEFLDMVSKSSVFVGVGRPAISPSPFDALCVGVPFVNPVLDWDEKDPMRKKGWTAQQWWMMDLEPPYVYHVWAGDEAGMKLAIQTAMDNPIESFIPERMTFEFVCDAIARVVEDDWKRMGERVLDERIRMGEGEVFII